MKIHFIALLLVLISSSVYADQAEIERENLVKLVTEIDFLIDRVERVKHQGFDQSRLKFNYQALSDDLILIRGGINDHLIGSLRSGRVIEALNGNYR